MRHVLVPLTVILALITGAVLEATRNLVLSPTVIRDGGSDARIGDALIRDLYAAVNATIATGDDTALDDLLSVDFVDHAPRPRRTPDRAGLLATVQSLHTIAPTRRLVIRDLVAEGDRVATRIEMEGAGAAVFLGLPVPTNQLWGATDVFRIVDGQVTEHWGDTSGGRSLTPLLAVDVEVSPPVRKAVTLARWTYAPGAVETQVTNTGFLILVVESGDLRVVFDPSSLSAVRLVPQRAVGAPNADHVLAPGERVTLRPGDALVVPLLNRFEVRNDGPMPASALAVVAELEASITQPMTGVDGTAASGKGDEDLADETAASGIAHDVLAQGMAENLPIGEVMVAIGQMTQPLGSPLPGHMGDVAAASAAAVWLETGVLVLTATGDASITEIPNALTQQAKEQTAPTSSGITGDASDTSLVVTVGAISRGTEQ